MVASLISEKMGTDIVALEIKKLSSVADYLVVCSAESDRQVQAIVRHIEDWGKKNGERPLSVVGADVGQWALVDLNDVVVHVFLDRVRGVYDLEGLWADAKHVSVTEKKAVAPKQAAPKKSAPKKSVSKKSAPKKTAKKPVKRRAR